jgi:7-cyano-7-deazaguanine synthase
MKSALLLSGGMDSLCIAWWKRPDIAITIDYGQLPAQAELASSAAICRELGIEHHIVCVDCKALGSGDMAGSSPNAHSPATDWWPYRNQMLVTMAAMKAIQLGVTRLMIGTVSSDGTHKDGTPEFVLALGELMAMQEGGMIVEAPAIRMTTKGLVLLSGVPESQLAWAHSCHRANVPCGGCRGCNKYLQTLKDLEGELDRSRQSSTAP